MTPPVVHDGPGSALVSKRRLSDYPAALVHFVVAALKAEDSEHWSVELVGEIPDYIKVPFAEEKHAENPERSPEQNWFNAGADLKDLVSEIVTVCVENPDELSDFDDYENEIIDSFDDGEEISLICTDHGLKSSPLVVEYAEKEQERPMSTEIQTKSEFLAAAEQNVQEPASAPSQRRFNPLALVPLAISILIAVSYTTAVYFGLSFPSIVSSLAMIGAVALAFIGLLAAMSEGFGAKVSTARTPQITHR